VTERTRETSRIIRVSENPRAIVAARRLRNLSLSLSRCGSATRCEWPSAEVAINDHRRRWTLVVRTMRSRARHRIIYREEVPFFRKLLATGRGLRFTGDKIGNTRLISVRLANLVVSSRSHASEPSGSRRACKNLACTSRGSRISRDLACAGTSCRVSRVRAKDFEVPSRA